LEETSRSLGKGKNWIIVHALEEFLAKIRRETLAGEARRQSLIASRSTTPDDEFWNDQASTEDWQ
jgi:hypothetical protein